jgi:beta-glucoside operon transcriptional antiterminator
MFIKKKINNNVALAEDGSGTELVVFGKGVGFPHMPYELADESGVSKRFYGIDPRLLKMAAALDDETILASSEVVDLAHAELGCYLNPNLVFTLADHLQFAIASARKGLSAENPLAGEIGVVYPREVAIGREAVELVNARCGVTIASGEAYAIAMHLVNAEMRNSGSRGDMDLVMQSTKVVEDIVEIVEGCVGSPLDRYSYGYVSFTTHLRYLVGRLRSSEAHDVRPLDDDLLEKIAVEFPKAFECGYRIKDYLEREHGWRCSGEETLYLMMHVNRFVVGY